MAGARPQDTLELELLAEIGVPAWAETRVFINGVYLPPRGYAITRPRRAAAMRSDA